MIRLEDITLKNIYYFITGNYRYYKFKKELSNLDFSDLKSDFNWQNVNDNMTVSHIQEQFLHRLYLVNQKSPECLTTRHCKICTCDTPQLLFADKGCEGACYGPLLGELAWNDFKEVNKVNMVYIFSEVKHLIK